MKNAKDPEITLTFDGKDVPMVPFVEDIIKESILGMVKTLKGYEEGMEVKIEIK